MAKSQKVETSFQTPLGETHSSAKILKIPQDTVEHIQGSSATSEQSHEISCHDIVSSALIPQSFQEVSPSGLLQFGRA